MYILSGLQLVIHACKVPDKESPITGPLFKGHKIVYLPTLARFSSRVHQK